MFTLLSMILKYLIFFFFFFAYANLLYIYDYNYINSLRMKTCESKLINFWTRKLLW
jgi:hypothetical protein